MLLAYGSRHHMEMECQGTWPGKLIRLLDPFLIDTSTTRYCELLELKGKGKVDSLKGLSHGNL